MLSYLKVKNLAIIDELEVDFSSGLNVLTGETGAGKSILIKSLQLILGSKANNELIRDEKKDLEVEAIFKFDNDSLNEHLRPLNASLDEENQIVIRRVLNANQSKIFVNGSTTSLSQLKKIGVYLLDICGQHEHQSLTDPQVQQTLIDQYGGHKDLLVKIEEAYGKIKEVEKEIEKISIDEDVKNQRLDYLKYQISEMDELELDEKEEEELNKKSKQLAGIKDISELCNKVEFGLYGDNPVMDVLEEIMKLVKQGKKYEDKFAKQEEVLADVLSKLSEFGDFFIDYGKKMNVDDEDLGQIYDRLDKINRIKKKFGGSIAQVLTKLEDLRKEYDQLQNQQEAMAKLDKQLSKMKANYKVVAQELSKSRQKVAQSLSQKVTSELQDLKMSGATFKINVEFTDQIRKDGADSISYLISPNKGEGLKSLDKIASGGELSRMLLAINRVVTEKSIINSFIFDEIDAGIGGEAGLVVGQKLKEIAKNHQVLCITHLPQVAVYANNHLLINKQEINKRVVSSITPLKPQGQVEEIARMLGGNLVKAQSLEHAKAMLAQAQKLK